MPLILLREIADEGKSLLKDPVAPHRQNRADAGRRRAASAQHLGLCLPGPRAVHVLAEALQQRIDLLALPRGLNARTEARRGGCAL